MNRFWLVRTLAVVMFTVIMAVAGAFAQDLPKIAVYVTGNVGGDEKEALGTRILASLVNSGRYKGIERSDSFLAEIEKEQVKQHSGDIDDNQISALGRQFGVKFVCIAAITPAFGEFQVSARIVDVETAQVEFIGESSGQLKSMTDLERVSDKVVENMFGGKSAQTAKLAQQPKSESHKESSGKPRIMDKKISLEIGGVFLPYSKYDYEYYEKNDNRSNSDMGVGGYLRIDLIYAEIAFDIASGIKEEWGILMPEVLGKYPIGNDVIKVIPLVGIGQMNILYGAIVYPVILGGRLDVGIAEIAYLRSEYLYCFGYGSGMSFKIGGGFDIGLGERKKFYIRPELMYSWIGAKYGEDQFASDERQYHLDLRVGIGYKWGGQKRVKEQ